MRGAKSIVLVCLLVLTAMASLGRAEAADWTWISSDSKYSKFYSPAQVRVMSSFSGVATRIEAWTKTTYSYAGAQETIQNYGIKAVVPNPAKLAYSLARVEVNPQNRTIEYVQENFYDQKGTIIWSKVYQPRTVKEINSQAFDEDFYTAIVDTVFHHGETDRRLAKDRWRSLWQAVMPDGSHTTCIGDTTTMRLRGNNMILWVWQENKGASGAVREIKFMKKAINLKQGTEKIINMKYWSSGTGWKDQSGQSNGLYYPVSAIEQPGLESLRAYAAGYTYWLHRYNLDGEK